MGLGDQLSRENEYGHRAGPRENGSRGMSRSVKLVLLSCALLVGLFGHAMNGWGLPILMAAAALFVPVFLLQFRKLWDLHWFWTTGLLLGAMQVPLVIAARRLLAHSRAPSMLAFGIIDGLLVIVVIRFCAGTLLEKVD
jgi:hypothetical protein